MRYVAINISKKQRHAWPTRPQGGDDVGDHTVESPLNNTGPKARRRGGHLTSHVFPSDTMKSVSLFLAWMLVAVAAAATAAAAADPSPRAAAQAAVVAAPQNLGVWSGAGLATWGDLAEAARKAAPTTWPQAPTAPSTWTGTPAAAT